MFVVAVVLAALVIPLAIGMLSGRWKWIPLAAAAGISVVAGLSVGVEAAPYLWPEETANGLSLFLVLIFGPIFAAIVAVPFAAASAAIGVLARKSGNPLDLPPLMWMGTLLVFEALVLWRALNWVGLGLHP